MSDGLKDAPDMHSRSQQALIRHRMGLFVFFIGVILVVGFLLTVVRKMWAVNQAAEQQPRQVAPALNSTAPALELEQEKTPH